MNLEELRSMSELALNELNGGIETHIIDTTTLHWKDIDILVDILENDNIEVNKYLSSLECTLKQ